MIDMREAGVSQFAASAAELRASHYRGQAARLREMAKAETVGRLRHDLVNLANKYEGLAARWNCWGAGLGD
jgi:hypothetical protein